jgi:tetratricopeptide (TPR) repeat protein
LDANHAAALANAGWALMRVGNTRGAADQFKAALAEAPTDTNALAGLAQAWLNEGQLQAAGEPIGALLRAAPNLAVGHRLLAEQLRRQRQLAKAMAAAREAVRLDPNEPLGYHILALCLSARKEHRLAVGVCDEGLAVSPNAAILLAQRADNLLQFKGAKAAGPNIEAALNLAPDMPYILRVAARVALAANQRVRARELLSLVLRRNANDREAVGLYLLTEPRQHQLLRTLYVFKYWRIEHGAVGVLASAGLWSLVILVMLPVLLITNVPGLLIAVGVRLFLQSQYNAHSEQVRAHFAQFALSKAF